MAAEVSTDVNIDLQSKFSLDNLADENFLRLILWFFLRQKTFLKSDLLPSLFSLLPLAMNAQEYIKSAECSLLDLKVRAQTTKTCLFTPKFLAVRCVTIYCCFHHHGVWNDDKVTTHCCITTNPHEASKRLLEGCC